MNFMQQPHHYRTIWISDIHLGTRGCKADFLLDFLKHAESEYLYLVGDIVDGWRMRRSWYWAQSHNDVIQKLLRKARKGTKVFYIPGNHDEWLRDYVDLQLGGVWLVEEAIHTTADGRRMLILHGDAFDGVVRYARWVALLGDWAYDNVLRLNHYYNVVRRKLGLPYWSLSAYLKSKVKNAVEYRCVAALDKLKVEGDEQIGVTIVRRALQEPLRQIAENAGEEGAIVLGKVNDSKDNNFGYNALTSEYEDLVKAGVLDPTKVVRTALQNAGSIASLMLTTEALVAEIPEEKKGSPMPGGHGGGGMGDMY